MARILAAGARALALNAFLIGLADALRTIYESRSSDYGTKQDEMMRCLTHSHP